MSIEGAILNRVVGSGQTDPSLLSSLTRIEKLLERQNIGIQEPIVILRSAGANLTVNHATDTIILESAPVAANTKVVIEDWNLNFVVTDGVVKVVILDANGNIINNILTTVNSSINGTGKTVMEPGNRLAVISVTLSATGTFGCYFSGYSQHTRGL